eukprot:gene5318-18564_t
MDPQSESHHRHHHPDSHTASASAQFRPTSAFPIQLEDVKLHPDHAQTLRSRLLNPAMTWWRHSRVSPAFLVAMCLLSAFCGSWIQMATEALPSPGGPMVTSVGRTGRQAPALSNSEGVHVIMTASASVSPAVTSVGRTGRRALALSNSEGVHAIITASASSSSSSAAVASKPADPISAFEDFAFNASGFSEHRPAEHIIATAKKHLSPSALAYKPGDSIPEAQSVRTSTGTFLSTGMDKEGVLDFVERKIAAVTHLPVSNGEPFNVLRYMPTQHYDSHYDTFNPKDFGKQYSTRIATFLLFLSDVEEGGETVFKREGKSNANLTINDWRTCADHLGIKVKPRQGDAVLFWSANPDLSLDDHSLHGACPVVKGEKWSAAKWLREH